MPDLISLAVAPASETIVGIIFSLYFLNRDQPCAFKTNGWDQTALKHTG
jgi:hypothetical protein